MSAPLSECERYDEALSELALGILMGRERAEVLADVEGCVRCGGELERLSLAADSVLEVVGEEEPPVGFEVGVLERLGIDRRSARTRRLRRALAVGALAGALGVGIGVGSLAFSGSSPLPRSVPAVEAAPVLSSNRLVGGALAYTTSHGSWLLMSVDHLTNGPVGCEIETTSGKTINLGQFWLTDDGGSWSVPLAVSPSTLRTAVLTSSKGAVVARATFPS